MKQIINLIFFLFIIVSIINAEPLKQDEYNKIISLLNKAGVSVSGKTINNICDSVGKEIMCNGSGSIYVIRLLSGTGVLSLVANDFTGFPELDYVSLKGYKLENQFLKDLNTANIRVSSLSLDNCGITNIVPCHYTRLTLNNNPLVQNQNMTSFNNFNYFEYSSGVSNIIWNNDLTELHWVRLSELHLLTNSFPNFTLFESTKIIIYVTPDFSDWTNVETISNEILSVEFKNNNPNQMFLTFPSHFASLVIQSTTLFATNSWSFASTKINWTTPTPLDFSKGNLTSFTINSGSFKSLDGYFPISKVNSQGFELSAISSSYKSVDMNVLRKMSQVDLSGNGIDMELSDFSEIVFSDLLFRPYDSEYQPKYEKGLIISNNKFHGKVPNYFCNLWVQFNNNGFTGELPSCYTCFLNETRMYSRISGNKFSNYQDTMKPSEYPPCTTIKINKFLVADAPLDVPPFYGWKYIFYIIGEDFGIDSTINAQITGSSNKYSFVPFKHNEIYAIPLTEQKYLIFKAATAMNVTFVAPNITFNLNITNVFDTIYQYNSPLITPFPNGTSTIIPTNPPEAPTTGSTTNNPTTSNTGNPTSSGSTTSDGSSTTGGTSSPTSSTTSSTSTSSTTSSPENVEPNSGSKLSFLPSLFILLLIVTIYLI